MDGKPKILIYEMYPAAWPGGFSEMTKHLERIAQLGGVDYVWLAPCYPSGGIDGGYDVTDYCAIDPRYGTMEDFDNFVQSAWLLGLEVVMDLVLNHTSDQHFWFQRSIQNFDQYADYYLWSDEDLGWGTMFDGSSAFEWNATRRQFYCHIYHKSQPDLNWDNLDVVEEFQQIIDFWTKRHGVAGFRIDSAQLIGKDFTPTLLPRELAGTAAGLSKYYQIPKTIDALERLFEGRRNLFTFGEMTALDKKMFDEMVAPNGPLTAGFNLAVLNAYDKLFGFINASPSVERVRKALLKWAKCPSFIAMLESHDTPRFTSRSGLTGQEAVSMLFGTGARIVCLYQGEELGLENPVLSDDITNYHDIQTIMRYEAAVAKGEDPQKVLTRLKPESRDNARVPLDLKEYERQFADKQSCWNATRFYITFWKNGQN